ncbi:hypothetical protein [Luteimonas granuli]|uniref:Uncharacterized protein n=1 Tax=Luteimonas granuli TaxID=1176533 RepID=A0A518N2D3_9GAMM|nr:hypothetical protein [Luteimonas granuli]QDW66058.1 hypothetical protein FPZ22_03400 [Luteimonas granuli]
MKSLATDLRGCARICTDRTGLEWFAAPSAAPALSIAPAFALSAQIRFDPRKSVAKKAFS